MISVIVFAEHSPEFLERCLESLAALPASEPPFEVLVADSGNDAARLPFAQPLVATLGERFRLLPAGGEARRPALLNRALAEARGEVVVFTHDDTRVLPGWLDALTGPLATPGVGCASGEDRLPPERRDGFSVSLDYVLRSPLGSGGMRRDRGPRFGAFTPRTWNMAARKSVLAAVGGFDPEAGEVAESVLASALRRAGHGLLYVPSAVVYHARETTLGETTALNFRRGREAAVSWRQGALRAGLPFALAAGVTLTLAAALGAAVLLPALRGAATALLLAYLGALFLLGAHAARVWRRAAPLLWVPLLVASQHLGHGAGFLAGLARGAGARGAAGAKPVPEAP